MTEFNISEETTVEEVNETSDIVIDESVCRTNMEFPQELNKFNWGAFGLTAYWGIGNKVYLGLLGFIPFFNFIWMFICGFKGNKWAWENGDYQSVEEFNKVQNTWKWPGIIVFIVQTVFLVFYTIFTIFMIGIGIIQELSDSSNYDMDYYSMEQYEKSVSNVSGWSTADYDNITLAKEITDGETNLVTYKDGSSFEELTNKVGQPSDTTRVGNIITAYWYSDDYETEIDIEYDLVSGKIITKSLY